MPDPDPIPKLRVLDDGDEGPAQEVVRLKSADPIFVPVAKIEKAPPPESAERIEAAARENYEGRSIEPTIDAILDPQEMAENIERPWGEAGTRIGGLPYGWLVLFGALALGIGVWSLRSMKKGEEKVIQVQETVREKAQQDELEDAGARELVGAVEKTVESYLAADTLERILPVVRDPQRVRPLIEETWAANPPRRLRFKRLAMFQPALLDGKSFWVVRADVEEGPSQNLLLEQTGDREVKVDWETHVCYQPMPWDRFAKERPVDESMEFRVWVVPDTLYSHEFSNTGKWSCFRLTAKDSEEHLFGYAAADSETAKVLRAYCAGSRNGTATVILSLRVPEQSASPRGVVIEKVVEPRWARVGGTPKNAP
jgi:hypothetical protein